MIPDDPRAHALQAWLVRQPGDFQDLRLLRADASFRRYFRVHHDQRPVIIMDAPPEHEDTRPFVRIAGLLQTLGLRPPRIHHHDPDTGFVLLEDLGDCTFTQALQEGTAEEPLYRRAVDALIQLHRAWPEQAASVTLPPYDTALLLAETHLLSDWYWPRIRGGAMPEPIRLDFEAAWRTVLKDLPALPSTLVLRDFHVDNLMLPPDNGMVDGTDCALLDFQDAVIGSPAYDLVSLLEDARRDVPTTVARSELEHFLSATQWPRASFLHHYRVLGVQRTIKILGIFVRLAQRDGKPRYLQHLPRLHRLLQHGLTHPELAPVAQWFERHLPERIPEPPACAR